MPQNAPPSDFIGHLLALKSKGHTSVSVDIDYLISQLTPRKPLETQKQIAVDGGKWSRPD
jgi:hypothetical protein